MSYIDILGQKAKACKKDIAFASTTQKNDALLEIAHILRVCKDDIIEANKVDLENGRMRKMSEAMLDRLALNDSRIEGMAKACEEQMLGGFYHPAFRELCEGRNYRRLIAEELGKHGNISDIASVVISVPKRQISKAIGQKKANIEYFKDLGVNIKIIGHEGSDKIKINEIIMRGGEK